MADENYTVAVTESGTDNVKAKILALADAQKKAETATGGLQRALGSIGTQNAALGNAFNSATASAKALDGAISPLQKSLGNNNAAFRSLADSTVLVANKSATMVGVVGTVSKSVYDQAKAAQDAAKATAEAGNQTSRWSDMFGRAKTAIAGYASETFSSANVTKTLGIAQNESANAATKHAGAMGNLRERTNDLREVMIGFVGIRVAQFFVAQAESARELTNSLFAMTAASGTFAETYSQIFASAQATNTSLGDSIGLYNTLASSMSTAGGAFVSMSGSAQIFTLTNDAAMSSMQAFQQALNIQGNSLAVNTKAFEAYNQAAAEQKVTLQTIQALGAAAPMALAQVSQSLQVAAGSTRGLALAAQQGRVTFAQFQAALFAAGEATKSIQPPPPTISSAFQTLMNSVQNYALSTNSAVGYTGFFSQALLLLSQNMNTVAPAALIMAGALSAIVIAITAIKLGVVIAEMIVFAATMTAAAIAAIAANLPFYAIVVVLGLLAGAAIYFSETLAKLTEGIPLVGTAFAALNEKAQALKETLATGWEKVSAFADKVKEMGNVAQQTEAQTNALKDAYKGFNGVVPLATNAANDNSRALQNVGTSASGASNGITNVGNAAAQATLGLNAFNTSALASQTIMSKWGYTTDLGTESAKNYEAQMRAAGNVLNGFGEWVKGASSAVNTLTTDMNELAAATNAAAGAGGSFGNAFNGGIFKPSVNGNTGFQGGLKQIPDGMEVAGFDTATGQFWYRPKKKTPEELDAQAEAERKAKGGGSSGGGGMSPIDMTPYTGPIPTGVTGGPSQPPVNVTNIFQVRDYDSFRRSEKQIAQDQLRMLSRA